VTWPTVEVGTRRVGRQYVVATLRVPATQPVYALALELTTSARPLRVRADADVDGAATAFGSPSVGRLRLALAGALPVSANGTTDVEVLVEANDDPTVSVAWIRVNEGPQLAVRGSPWRRE